MRISDWSSDVCSSDLPRSCVSIGAAPFWNRQERRHRRTRPVAFGRPRHQAASNMYGSGDGARSSGRGKRQREIGRAHVRTPVTNAHLACRLLLEKKKKIKNNRLRLLNNKYTANMKH